MPVLKNVDGPETRAVTIRTVALSCEESFKKATVRKAHACTLRQLDTS